MIPHPIKPMAMLKDYTLLFFVCTMGSLIIQHLGYA